MTTPPGSQKRRFLRNEPNPAPPASSRTLHQRGFVPPGTPSVRRCTAQDRSGPARCAAPPPLPSAREGVGGEVDPGGPIMTTGTYSVYGHSNPISHGTSFESAAVASRIRYVAVHVEYVVVRPKTRAERPCTRSITGSRRRVAERRHDGRRGLQSPTSARILGKRDAGGGDDAHDGAWTDRYTGGGRAGRP